MSKTFSMRTSCPGQGNKNFITTSTGGWNTCINGNPRHPYATALANCVGYASGRFNEIINEARGTTGCTYKTLNCNAENFIERAIAAGLKVGSTPRIGAIGCAQKGATLSGSDGAGHVWIVEDYDPANPNYHYSSESGYGSSYFWNGKRYNTNGKWGLGSGYKFRGFIYLPDDVQAIVDAAVRPTPPAPTPSSYKYKVGDKVIINGSLYVNANADSPAGHTGDRETKITRVVDGKHPYNTTGDLGWMDEGSIRLRNSGGSTTTYVVQKGDCLSSIGKKFNVKWQDIATLNNISGPKYIIYTGQTLKIPTSSSQPVSPSINKGDKVKVKNGAKTYTGGNLASFVYNNVYDVIEVKGDRAVIGKGSAVTAAVNTKDLYKA